MNNEIVNFDEYNRQFMALISEIKQRDSELVRHVGINSENILQLASIVNNQSKALSEMSKRLDAVENSAVISTQQAMNIRKAVSERVFGLIGNDPKERAIATRLFHQRCYYDATRNAGLCRPYRETPRKNYDNVMKYVKSWFPHGGVTKLMNEAMRNHDARKAINGR